jgi:hypothetical protein
MNQPDPALGVILHAIGGLASASLYLPFRGIKGWSWESYWLVGGVFRNREKSKLSNFRSLVWHGLPARVREFHGQDARATSAAAARTPPSC